MLQLQMLSQKDLEEFDARLRKLTNKMRLNMCVVNRWTLNRVDVSGLDSLYSERLVVTERLGRCDEMSAQCICAASLKEQREIMKCAERCYMPKKAFVALNQSREEEGLEVFITQMRRQEVSDNLIQKWRRNLSVFLHSSPN